MSNDTIELLKECSEGVKMATGSIEHIMDSVDSKEMQSLLGDYQRSHREIETKADNMLAQLNEEAKEPSKTSKLFANLTTGMKLALDNSSHEAAKLLMDGCNMGIQSMSEYCNRYTEASKESQELAEKLILTEQRFMNDLRRFL